MSTRKNLLIGVFGATFLTAATQAGTFEDNLTREFMVKSGGKLTLEADEGTISVLPWNRNTVRVEIERSVRSGSKAEAEEQLRDWTFDLQQKGNSVQVTAERTKGNDSGSIELSFTVMVPTKFSLDLETAGGSITVTNLEGDVVVETAGGSVDLGEITGSIDASTSGGSIGLGLCTGNTRLATAGGDIDVDESRGDLVAETSGGSIHVAFSKGPVLARTAGGNIALDHALGGFDLETAGGNIHTRLKAQPDKESRMSTAAGNIRLEMPGTVNLDVDARTSAGHIRSDFPVDIQGEYLEFHAKGRINRGGTGLVLRTSAGNIELDKI